MSRKSEHYTEGEKVKWKWGNGWGRGTVQSVFHRKVTRKIGGKEITRDGSADEPAYTVARKKGNNVLKSHSELQKDS